MKPTRSTPTTKPGAIAVAAENEIDPAALHMPPVIEPEALVLPRSSRANTNQASQAISSPPPMQNVTGPDDSVRSNIRDPHQRRNLKNKEKPKVAATTPGAVAVSASIPETTADDDDDDDNNNTTTTNNNESPNPAKNAKQRKGRRTPAALVPGAVAVSNNDATRNTKSPRAAKKMSNADTPNASSSPGAVRVDGPVGDILAVKAGYAKRATFRSTSSSTSASSTTTTTTTIGAAAAGSPVKTASTTSQSQTPGATAVSGAETTESVLSAKERFAVQQARLGQSKAPTGGDPPPIGAMGVLDDTSMEAEVTSFPNHNKTDVRDNNMELLMRPTTISSSHEAHHTQVSYEHSGEIDVEKSNVYDLCRSNHNIC